MTERAVLPQWRWVYRLAVIMNGVSAIGFFIFYKPPVRIVVKTTFREKLALLDWVSPWLLGHKA